MLKFTPILLIIIYSFAMWFFSAWRLKHEMNKRSTPLDDPQLNLLLDRLSAAMNLPRINAQIYEVETVNGLATPDGRIFITRGFMNHMKKGDVTADEIASVIAHELGHVTYGHARRRLIDFTGQNILRNILMISFGRFVPLIGPWLINLVTIVLAAHLSQKDEFEADQFATALLIRSGIGPRPQITLFEKLNTLTHKKAASTPAWLLSHPGTEKRIDAIRRNIQNWQTPTK